MKNEEDNIFSGLVSPSYSMPDYTKIATLVPPYGQAQADVYMTGLKSQVRELEESLKPNQQLIMACWHCGETLRVLSVSMPSNNVVALQCNDSEGNAIQVTGHMNAITFSFRIITESEPVERKKIGFN